MVELALSDDPATHRQLREKAPTIKLGIDGYQKLFEGLDDLAAAAETMSICIVFHARAFTLGIISAERLRTVLLGPFFKLTRKVAEVRPPKDARDIVHFRAKVYEGWSHTVKKVVVEPSNGQGRDHGFMSVEKRSEALHAFLEAGFARVCSNLDQSVPSFP